jgi:hypothetical protein
LTETKILVSLKGCPGGDLWWVSGGVRFLRTQQRVKSQCLYFFLVPWARGSGSFLCGGLGLWVCGGVPLGMCLLPFGVGGVPGFDFLLGFGMPACVWVCRWALMESLILAQDERWRRA